MKPLFRDPGEGDEREDGFSQPHGFLLGPMGMIDRAEMADQYFRAANLLINRIDQQEVADYEVAYPVLFLYRHALELVMKCILGGGSHHRLDALAGDLVTFVKKKHGQVVPAWITKRLHELAKIDPTSEAFRYGEDKYHGKGNGRTGIRPETYVRVSELRDELNSLYRALRRALIIQQGGPSDMPLPV